MFRRHITSNVLAALTDTPVVLLHGARQTGKSTLAQELASAAHPARYITLDDAAVLAAAKADGAGFIDGLEDRVVLDEIQRAPELLIPIKAAVDRERRPGRFLLTGSANVLLLPTLTETLAGRMEVLPLWPLSQGEIENEEEDFISRAFGSRMPQPPISRLTREDLARRVTSGGYPEAVLRAPTRRLAWFQSYVTTVLHRTVRDIADIERLHELPRLLNVLAARTGTLLNVADVSRTVGIPLTTLQRYLSVLQAAFLVQFLPAWAPRVRRRLLKSPKVLLTDTGLASHLVGLDGHGLTSNVELWGAFVETFVAMEIIKQGSWSKLRPTFYHFRTAKGDEVDVVLEAPSGGLVGVEVKTTLSLNGEDFRGLRVLAEIAGRRFVRGILLYLGEQAISFGPNLHALPIASVWRSKRASTRSGAHGKSTAQAAPRSGTR